MEWPSDRLNNLSEFDSYMRNDRMIDPKLRLASDLTQAERDQASREFYTQSAQELEEEDPNLPLGWSTRQTKSNINPHTGAVEASKTSVVSPPIAVSSTTLSAAPTTVSSTSITVPASSTSSSSSVLENPFSSNRHAGQYEEYLKIVPSQPLSQVVVPPQTPIQTPVQTQTIIAETIIQSADTLTLPRTTTRLLKLEAELEKISQQIEENKTKVQYIRQDMGDCREAHPNTYSTRYEYLEMTKMLAYTTQCHLNLQQKELILLKYVYA